jgi:hypothetical protein
LDFFELTQSGGSEQNSVSIALKPLYEGACFKPWQELTEKTQSDQWLEFGD